MSKTSANIIADALDLLGRGPGVGQAVPAEDYETINGFIAPLYRQLSCDNVVTIGDWEAIPDEIYIPLTALLANAAAPKFDMPQDDAKRVMLEMQIRKIVNPPELSRSVRAEYF